MRYRRGTSRFSTALEDIWQARFLVELKFLLEHLANKKYVIHISSGPLHHLTALKSVFPHLSFFSFPNLPTPLALSRGASLEAPSRKFDMDVAQFFGEQSESLLVIFDLRTPPTSHDDFSACAASDMKLQMSYFEALGRPTSLLRLHLPYADGTTVLPKGRVLLIPFGPATSTESCLAVRHGERATTAYNHRCYEEHMFFHNQTSRAVPYSQDQLCLGASGCPSDWTLDCCFDCTYKLVVLDQLVQVLRNRSFLNRMLLRLCPDVAAPPRNRGRASLSYESRRERRRFRAQMVSAILARFNACRVNSTERIFPEQTSIWAPHFAGSLDVLKS